MDKKKCFVKVLKEKKLFKNLKTSVQKKNPQYLHFSKWVSPCFFSKSGDFSIVCFYAKWIKKKCFLKFWKKKEAFLDYKNIGSKNPPNVPFLKGVSP